MGATAVACRWKIPFLCILLLAVSPAPHHVATAAAGACNGSTTECLQGGGAVEEWQMESETARRVLAYSANYIDYRVLERPACENPRGAPYTQGHGCLVHAVHPHSRGCEDYYRCRH